MILYVIISLKVLGFDQKVTVISSLISTQQTAYIKNRFIGEGGRLISDIINICDRNNSGGFLVTIDIEKVFDSIDHKFILAVLKKFGFVRGTLSQPVC